MVVRILCLRIAADNVQRNPNLMINFGSGINQWQRGPAMSQSPPKNNNKTQKDGKERYGFWKLNLQNSEITAKKEEEKTR